MEAVVTSRPYRFAPQKDPEIPIKTAGWARTAGGLNTVEKIK
jgi:hypothetical protein